MATPHGRSSPNNSQSPSRRTRQQEKEELQQLNDRFVTYIDRVRRIREEKTSTESAFRSFQETQEIQSDSLRKAYERELSEARALIDDTAKEKAHFQILAQKHEERIADLEDGLKDAQDEVAKLRQLLNVSQRSHDATDLERKQALADKRAADEKVKELEEDLETVQAMLKQARESLEQETLTKVDLQNKIQSLKEEMLFKNRVHDEAMSTYRKKTYVDVSYDQTDSADDFAERLQAAIDEAREEMEKETEQHRMDLQQVYQSKFEVLENQSLRDSAAISNMSSQIRELNEQLSIGNNKVTKLQDMNERLEGKIRQLEEQMARRKQQHSEEVARIMEELRALRQSYEEKIQEYEQLLDLRVQLEQEIKTLSVLLQEEEERLNLSTPMREKRQRTKQVHSAEPQAKKTRRSREVSSSATASGFIQICDVDPEGGFVQLKNTSEKIVNLGNYKIVHEVEGTAQKKEFRFHSKSKLHGGSSVTVWAAGADGATHRPPSDFIWKSCNMWGSGSKTITSLYPKSGGDSVATFTQRKEVCTTTSSSSFTLDETDAGVRNFPNIPPSPVVRGSDHEEEPLPQVGNEHVFHQQGDPQVEQPAGNNNNNKDSCVIC